mgnify:CR=1 FL=1
MPTVLEVAGGAKPADWKGEPIPPAPGRSLVPAFARDGAAPHDYLWWLHEGNRAIRAGDWKLVAAKGDAWELYNLKTDRAETKNLAAQMPEKVKELSGGWEKRTAEFTELASRTPPAPARKPGRAGGRKADR